MANNSSVLTYKSQIKNESKEFTVNWSLSKKSLDHLLSGHGLLLPKINSGLKDIIWSILLYTSGDNLKFFYQCAGYEDPSLLVKVIVYLKAKSSGSNIMLEVAQHSFQDENFPTAHVITPKATLSNPDYLINNEITLIFKFTVQTAPQHIVSPYKNEFNLPPNNAFKDLLETGLHSNVILTVGGKKFKAHRSILAVRCEYFKVMFESNFVEATSANVVIKDIKADIFDMILRFIYLNQVPEKLEFSKARDLLAAAHKLMLKSLLEWSEQFLYDGVNVDNCLELWKFAEIYECDKLKSHANKFAVENLANILQSNSWKELKEQDTTEALQLLEELNSTRLG